MTKWIRTTIATGETVEFDVVHETDKTLIIVVGDITARVYKETKAFSWAMKLPDFTYVNTFDEINAKNTLAGVNFVITEGDTDGDGAPDDNDGDGNVEPSPKMPIQKSGKCKYEGVFFPPVSYELDLIRRVFERDEVCEFCDGDCCNRCANQEIIVLPGETIKGDNHGRK